MGADMIVATRLFPALARTRMGVPYEKAGNSFNVGRFTSAAAQMSAM
jgi:hypothetical protein